jgi:hypothetical protein
MEFGFIDHLQIVTTSNYSAISNSHTLQFTTACTMSSQSAVFSTCCRLVTASNAVVTSASAFTFLLSGDCLTNWLLGWRPSHTKLLLFWLTYCRLRLYRLSTKSLTNQPTSLHFTAPTLCIHDWLFTANHFVLAPNPLRPKTRDSFFNWNLAVIVLM